MSKKLLFAIDGVLLSDYGLHVESCSGLISIPKRKAMLSNDDALSHGKFYDLQTQAKYSEKTIVLNCFINTSSRVDFFSKINGLISVFDAPGLHRLSAVLDTGLKLPYEVIRTENAPIEPTWSGEKTIAKFKLTFIEPQPIKRVIIADGGKVSLSLHSEKLITIGWGDGSYSYDLSGDILVEKTLTAGAQVVIVGDIEEITNYEMTGGTAQCDIWC